MPNVNVNYAIPGDLHKRAKVAAAEAGITLREFVIRALVAAVEQAEKGRRPRK
ncbi:MAG TPA: toxin-antitoxin system HicB family antitoxin [Acidimicrobiia bacterium]